MTKSHLPWLAAVLGCQLLFGFRGYSAQPAAEQKEDQNDRKIAVSDIIIVEVFGEKELSGEHRVQQSGTITYPLLGSVEVARKTPAEVSRLLQEKLKADYLVDPQVNVMVKEYRLRTVSVIGKVNQEGAIELPAEQPMDILEAIARARGFSATANKNKIELSHHGKTTVYKFDDLKRVKDQDKKVWLEPGDVIYVHEAIF
jgi:polysaccharide export outer membrane protein